MKYLLSLFLLIPCMSHAQQGGQYVNTVYGSTNTITQTVNIGSVTVTNLTTAISTGTISGGYLAIEIYNTLAGNKIVYGFDAALSTFTNSVWYGRELATGTAITLYVPSYRPVYALSTVATSSVTVTQFR